MNELWKDVVGFEGLYKVSNQGNVKSLKRYHASERILKPQKTQDGYLTIGLHLNKKIYVRQIHRLVAESFIPNPSNKATVNHIDGNKQNNCVENLEWCSTAENMAHAFAIGLRKRKEVKPKTETSEKKGNKLTQSQVDNIRKEYQKGKYGFGCKALARKYNVSSQTIKDIIKQKIWREG